jgi:hypothetical protein
MESLMRKAIWSDENHDPELNPNELEALRVLKEWMQNAEHRIPLDKEGDEKTIARIDAEISGKPIEQDINEAPKEWAPEIEASRTRNDPRQRG